MGVPQPRAWSKGGKASAANCQMLLQDDNPRIRQAAQRLSHFHHSGAGHIYCAVEKSAYRARQIIENNWRKRVRVERTIDIEDANRRF